MNYITTKKELGVLSIIAHCSCKFTIIQIQMIENRNAAAVGFHAHRTKSQHVQQMVS